MTPTVLLCLLALLIGLLVAFGIAVGPLDPIALAGIGIIILAVAILV